MICKGCSIDKAAGDFYASNPNKCKECVKADVRANRAENIEYYRRYDKIRYREPDRNAYQRQQHIDWRNNNHGRDVELKKAWIERNPEKRAAHIKVNNAVKNGKLVKKTCEVCGSEKVHAHHDDYSKPFDVRWLCPIHHAEVHLID